MTTKDDLARMIAVMQAAASPSGTEGGHMNAHPNMPTPSPDAYEAFYANPTPANAANAVRLAADDHRAYAGVCRDTDFLHALAVAADRLDSHADLVAALLGLLALNSVNTLESAIRTYPHGREDVAADLAAFDAARAALSKAGAP